MKFDKLEIITNNLNMLSLGIDININYQSDVNSVLSTVRDKVHTGSQIISHPLAGSVKPHETPYRSIVIYNNKGTLNIESLCIIEQAIKYYHILCEPNPEILSFSPEDIDTKFAKKAAADFRFVDKQLVISCLVSLGRESLPLNQRS